MYGLLEMVPYRNSHVHILVIFLFTFSYQTSLNELSLNILRLPGTQAIIF